MKLKNIHLPLSLMDLSHEIRTPLTGISGMAEFLGQSLLSAQQRSYVEDIQRSCARLQKLAELLSNKANVIH